MTEPAHPERTGAGVRAGDDVSLSIVIPAYREGGYLGASLSELTGYCRTSDEPVEVLVVDDGSDDETVSVAERAQSRWPAPHRLRVLKHTTNRGKGAAVRTGILAARGAFCLFTDADLAYGTEPIAPMLTELAAGADVVAGVRAQHSGLARRLSGWAFANLVRRLDLAKVPDPQCGIKAFRTPSAQLIFGLAGIDGFAFDVEVFYLASRYEMDIRYVPVSMRRPVHTSVNLLSDAPRMVGSLFEIKKRAEAGDYEVPAPAPRARVRRDQDT